MMIIKAVMFSFRFGGVIRLIGGDKSGIKNSGTEDFVEIRSIYGTTQKY